MQRVLAQRHLEMYPEASIAFPACGVQLVMEMLIVYPNKMDFPIMEDFGIAPPPLGMLEVAVGAAALASTQMLGTHSKGLYDGVLSAL